MGNTDVPPGIRAEELATICGVSLRTARRWKACGAMPAGFGLGLALLRDGDLGLVSAAWRGWKLLRGELVSPDNWTFRPGEIAALPITLQLVGELRRQLATPAQFALL